MENVFTEGSTITPLTLTDEILLAHHAEAVVVQHPEHGTFLYIEYLVGTERKYFSCYPHDRFSVESFLQELLPSMHHSIARYEQGEVKPKKADDEFSRWFRETFSEMPWKGERVPFEKLPANMQALTFTQAMHDYKERHPSWQPGDGMEVHG